MSDAADKLARTRLAIIAHLQRNERHHERRQNEKYELDDDFADDGGDGEPAAGKHRRPRPAGWLGHAGHVLATWWRHHPAHMGVELVTPVLSQYAARKPAQYLGIAALVGVLFAVVRPWRLISLTGLIVALVKSSQLSGVLLSAMSGIDDGRDRRPPK